MAKVQLSIAVLIEAHPWPVVDSILIALPLSAITLVRVSLFTGKLPAGHLDTCFRTDT